MKKFIIIFAILFISTGCTQVNNDNIDKLCNNILASKSNVYNHVNRGFKYYLPINLKSVRKDEYNEILKDKHYEYYLYVDLVSYYNKVSLDFEPIEGAYYTKTLDNNEKSGIINVTTKDNAYLVSVSYNYASVEVLVKEKDIGEAITNSLIIVSTIKYNDDVIKKLLESNIFSSNDEIVDIFNEKPNNNEIIDINDDGYNNSNNEVNYDPDFIK